jgi:two-component system NtrC family response regulator
MEFSVSNKNTLLIVEDDEGLREQLSWCFSEYEVVTAGSRQDAIAKLRRHEPRVVTLDLGLPPNPDGFEEGILTLKEIAKLSPKTKVIMVTGQSDKDIALQAISYGAYDFYTKPIEAQELVLLVKRAFYLSDLEAERDKLTHLAHSSRVNGIISSNPLMLKVCRTIEKIAPNNITTLLLGESGTGKEVLARGIHQLSDRNNKPFVAVNCAAIPENLLESELFGYEKGAFTGAQRQTSGKIERANGGTFFLDEVGDLPANLQPKLLRFLQERVIERLGGRQEIPVDVRVVCATHQNLEELILQNMFREDLFYRLSEVTVKIPPLRHRCEDSILLAQMFLKRYAEEFNKPIKRFNESALSGIQTYSWPGNVRELENRIKRAVIMADTNYIEAEDLDLPFIEQNAMPFNLREVRETAEKDALIRALNSAGNNISRAAELLGVTRPTLYNLLEKLDLKEYSPADGQSE